MLTLVNWNWSYQKYQQSSCSWRFTLRKNSKENFKSLTAQSSSIWINPRRPWVDMCYALAGMPDIVSKYGRLKYAGEYHHYEHLWRYTYYSILKMGKEYGWKFGDDRQKYWRSGPSFAVRLAELAMQESVGSERCRKCNGRGSIYTGYKTIDCFSCQGSGVQKKTENYRSKFVGLDQRTWHRYWKYRFRQHILGIFDVFEFEISKELNRRL